MRWSKRWSRWTAPGHLAADVEVRSASAAASYLSAKGLRLIGDPQRQFAIGKGVLINSGAPLAGLSPAAEALAPFWELLANRHVPVLAHVGSDLGFLASAEWSNAASFAPNKLSFDLPPS